MSSGSPITIPEEIAEAILDADGQLLKIPDDDGSWSGKTINKAHIVSTDYDLEKERSEAEKLRYNTPKLEPPKMTEDQRKQQVETLNKIRRELINKRVIKK